MERYYNRAGALKDLQQLAKQQGTDLEAAMRAVGLSMALLRQPDERIDFARLCALLEHCALAWDMPDLALRLASHQPLEALGPLGLVTRMAPDLRGVVDAIGENMVIHSNAVIARVTEEDGVATAVIDTLSRPPGVDHLILLALGLARNIIERVGNAPLDLIEVSLRQIAGPLRPSAEAWFHCPVRFGAEQNALHFDAAILDRPIAQSDEAYHAIIRRYFTAARLEGSDSIAAAARHEIARQMEFGGCTLDSLATRLRIEPRGLQRRLKQEGTSFTQLMDDWRRARALSLVTATRLPLSQITLALGFADPSVFTRAYQRWYGQSPRSARQKGR